MMRLTRFLVLSLAAQVVFSGLAEAQQTKPSGSGGGAKAPSTAECVMMLGPFRGKSNAAIKDKDVEEYAPLVKSYWAKRCPAKLYEEEVADPDLRKRLDAAAPRPKAKRPQNQAQSQPQRQ